MNSSTPKASSTYRINRAKGATVTISPTRPTPAPYLLDVTWPNGKTERITPRQLDEHAPDGQNKDKLLDYARAFVVDVVQSGDYLA